MVMPFHEKYWESADGLQLYFRDYDGRNDRPPVICLHGLTRNSRDFESLAEDLAGDWRVIVPEMRGRGQSDYAKDPMSYNPRTYIGDLELLLAQEGIAKFVSIGTSMGGLMTMLMAASNPTRIAAAVLNDIGPEIDRSGLDRIANYVGQGRNFDTWIHAARSLQELHGPAFPDFDLSQWLTMAKRSMVLGQNGRISLDYDMAIAEPFRQADNVAPANLWPAFDAMKDIPLTLLRGEISDLLSVATVNEMKRRHPTLQCVTIPRVGHAPTLDEPESRKAILNLLNQID